MGKRFMYFPQNSHYVIDEVKDFVESRPKEDNKKVEIKLGFEKGVSGKCRLGGSIDSSGLEKASQRG